MAKRKQQDAAQPTNGPAAAEAAAGERAGKRRRSPRSAARPAPKAGTPASRNAARRSGDGSAAAAAAAAAAGRAESDVDDDGEEEQAAAAAAAAAARGPAPADAALQAEEEEQEAAGHAGGAGEQAGEDKQRRWVGVYGPITLRRSNAVRWGASVLFFPHQGSRERRELKMGHHATQEAAARIHDRAVIALHGRKGAAASGLLNFGVEQYPGEQQRYGPDLNAFLLNLCALGERRMRGGKKERPPRVRKGASAEQMHRMLEERMAKAAAAPPAAYRIQEGLSVLRRVDPLHTDQQANCGVCPACRQPWRTDLGGCQRKATAKAAGHSEKAVLEMLACDKMLCLAALEKSGAVRLQKQEQAEQLKAQREAAAASEDGGGQEEGAAGEGAGVAAGGQPGLTGLFGGEQRLGQQQQQQASGRAAGPLGAAGVDEKEEELDWLEEPPKRAPQQQARLQRQLRALRNAAAAPLDQQQAWQEAQLAAALEQEEQQQGTAAGAGSGPGAAAGAAGAAGVGQVQPAERALVDPASGFTRAAPPRNVFPQPRAGELLQLAGLCREGGMQAPLVAEAAVQALTAAEQQQAQQEQLADLLLRRAQRGRSSSRGGSPNLEAQLADAAEVEAAAAEAAAAASESGASEADAAAGSEAGDDMGQAHLCPLCGGKSHRLVGLKACPVLKMALAVPKAPPDCRGCAHLEEPGCELCLSSKQTDKSRQALERPFVRRAPWLEDVLPATREFMQAMQVAASAAVVDFDLPGAAWRCTPRALLAAGLLAEEAAKRELAARFLPPPPPQPPQQQQEQPLPDG